MSDIRYHPMWPAYKRMRHAVGRVRKMIGVPFDDAAIDADLDRTIAARTAEMLHLFYRDRNERETRTRLQGGRVA